MSFERFVPGVPAAARSGHSKQRRAAWVRDLDAKLRDAAPLVAPHDVELEFRLARDPAEEANPKALHGADVDNLASVVLDRLKLSVLGGDDSTVVRLCVTKRRVQGEEPSGVLVRVR